MKLHKLQNDILEIMIKVTMRWWQLLIALQNIQKVNDQKIIFNLHSGPDRKTRDLYVCLEIIFSKVNISNFESKYQWLYYEVKLLSGVQFFVPHGL